MKKLLFLITILLIPAFADTSIAPNFTLEKLGEKGDYTFKTPSQQYVVLDFWATWCPPCRVSLPKLQKLQDDLPQLKFIGINIDNERVKAEKFMKQRKITFTNVYDKNKDLVKKFQIQGMPSLFVIDKNGTILKRLDGYSENEVEELKSYLSKLAKD